MKSLFTLLAVFFLASQTQAQVQLWQKGKLKTEGNFKWVNANWISLYTEFGTNRSESFQLKNIDSLIVLDSTNAQRMVAENYMNFIFRPVSNPYAESYLVPDSALAFDAKYLLQLERAGDLISEGGSDISTGAIVSLAGTAIVLLGTASGSSNVALIGALGGGFLSIVGVVSTLIGGTKIQQGGKMLRPLKTK